VRISERSWHFKLARGFWSHKDSKTGVMTVYTPKDLCSYFWAVMVPLVFLVFLAVGGMFVVSGFILFLATHWREALIILGIFAGCFATAGIGWCAQKLAGYLWRRIRRTQVTDDGRPKNIVVAYVVAKKRRICPLIEVVD
jgi:hypothetical protein